MRNLFPSYYGLTDEQYSELWQECIISFDTNVLLNIYRYTPQTRERFFEILRRLGDRIWITHQAAQEYQDDRLTVISSVQLNAYRKVRALLNDFFDLQKLNQLKNQLNEYKRHPFINIDEIIYVIEKQIKTAIRKAETSLKSAEDQHPDLIKFDTLRETLTEILTGKVGNSYFNEELNKICQEAEEKISAKKPPGYKDEGKEAPGKYGDYIIWHQLIRYAMLKKKPVIFVTDDRKEDWWHKHDGKTLGPRRELIEEMLSKAGVSFWMYSSSKFIEQAENFLKLSHQQEVIEEAEEISYSNNESSKNIEFFFDVNSRSSEAIKNRGLDTVKFTIDVQKSLEEVFKAFQTLNLNSDELGIKIKKLDAVTSGLKIPTLEARKIASRMPSLDAVTSGLKIPTLEAITTVQLPSSIKSLLDSDK